MIRGAFDRFITVRRAVVVADEYGGETQTWADLENAWARVRFGLAQEKREAAQQSASQTATFEVIPTQALLGVRSTDRIAFDGSDWDIVEVAPLERSLLRFTAVRNK